MNADLPARFERTKTHLCSFRFGDGPTTSQRLAAELALLASAISGLLSAFEGTTVSSGLEAALWCGFFGYVAGFVAGEIIGAVARERAVQTESETWASNESGSSQLPVA